MTKQDLAALGITTEDVLKKVVEKISDAFIGSDEDGATDFYNQIERSLKAITTAKLDAIFAEHIQPAIGEMIENHCLQATNEWGEKCGKKLTFTEYLVERADAYIREPVDYRGKSKDEESYNWTGRSTRITFLIHEHLQHRIEQAMAKALGEVNSSVCKGLEEAVNMAIKRVTVKVDTTVKT
jgi:hypothetical protein